MLRVCHTLIDNKKCQILVRLHDIGLACPYHAKVKEWNANGVKLCNGPTITKTILFHGSHLGRVLGYSNAL